MLTKDQTLSRFSSIQIDEQASLHSISDSNETSSQPADNPIIQDVEETAIIEVEVIVEEAATPPPPPSISNDESTPLSDPIPVSTSTTTKSWWSSIARLFHFGSNHNESKGSIESNGDDLPSSPFCDGNYLSNIKSRRSLHTDTSLVN